MNDNIVLAFISGDKNEYDGKTTICLNQNINNSSNNINLLSLNNKEDFDKLDTLLLSLTQNDNSIFHLNVLKEIIKTTRKNIFPHYFIDKFNLGNETILFNILAEMGNIVIQNSEYVTIIYAPKFILDQQKESLNNLKQYFVDKQLTLKIVLDGMNDKYTRYKFDNVEDLYSHINQKRYK